MPSAVHRRLSRSIQQRSRRGTDDSEQEPLFETEMGGTSSRAEKGEHEPLLLNVQQWVDVPAVHDDVQTSEGDAFDGTAQLGRFRGMAGVVFLAISAFFFSVAALFVKLATDRGVPAIHVIAWRGIVQGLLSALTCIFYLNSSPLGPPSQRPFLLARGFFGSMSLAFFYIAIEKIPFGDANAIFFTSPFFATLFAYLWLGEVVSVHYIFTGVMSFTGVMLISVNFNEYAAGDLPPPIIEDQVFGVFDADLQKYAAVNAEHHGNFQHAMYSIVVLIGAVLSGMAFTCVRRIGKAASPMQMVFYFGLVGAIIFVPASFFFQSPFSTAAYADSFAWFHVLSVGVTAYVAQTFLNAGLQMEKVGIASFIRNLDIFFAFLYQVYLLHEPARMYSIIGASLIASSSFFVFIAKCVETRVLTWRRR